MDSFQLFENSRVFLRFFSEGKTKRILIFQSFSSRGKNFKDAKFERISSFYKLEWFSTTFRGESILDLQLFFSRGKDFPVARFFFFFFWERVRVGQGASREPPSSFREKNRLVAISSVPVPILTSFRQLAVFFSLLYFPRIGRIWPLRFSTLILLFESLLFIHSYGKSHARYIMSTSFLSF